jgi:cyclopropane fatty-acyl-phospholipid synthase-like methyltransferase
MENSSSSEPNILNWKPDEDKFLKSKEIDIHNQYHSTLADKKRTTTDIFGTNRRKMRIRALHKALRQTNVHKLSGKVLEVGAGDGWCSAYILKTYNIDHVHTMEINPAAVERLIPKTMQTAGVDLNKCTPVLGSFNDIPLVNYFDFVVAMGALHHSANMFQTFSAIFRSLKPGGWLFAQEPYMPDNTMNDFYHERNKLQINFKGILQVKNEERSDIFYRSCEYKTAAFHAGYNFYSDEMSINTLKTILRTNLNRIKGKKRPKSAKNMVIMAQKPLNASELPRPVTSWEYPD